MLVMSGHHLSSPSPMSAFFNYLAMPHDAPWLRIVAKQQVASDELARQAEAALELVLLGGHLTHPFALKHHFPLASSLWQDCLDHPQWHLDSWPMKVGGSHALAAAINQRNDSRDGRVPGFENSLGMRVVTGEQGFNQHFVCGEHGAQFRVSPPGFVRASCAQLQALSRTSLDEALREHLDRLRNYFEVVAQDERLAVLVMSQ